MKKKFQAVPYVMQPNFVSVIWEGRPFPLLASHPTFKALVSALKNKQWSKIGGLVNMAQSISNRSHGNITVKGGKVYYKGGVIDSSMSKRLLSLIENDKPVGGLIKFMDNLMKNPSETCIKELYDFLGKCNLPITDDGCFVAYKRLNTDYTDCHSSTVDNSIGRVIFMPRKSVDDDNRLACSSGYHFCSRGYLRGFHTSNSRLVAIKVNPADVVAIPHTNEEKGRTWRYEVLREIPNGNYVEDDADFMKQVIVPVAHDRKELIAKLLELPLVKRLVARTERAIKANKLKKTAAHRPVQVAGLTKKAIQKASIGRLTEWYKRFAALAPQLPTAPEQSPLFQNPTGPARIDAGLSIVAVAKAVGIKPSDAFRMEKSAAPKQTSIDRYLQAILELKSNPAGMSYAKAASATA